MSAKPGRISRLFTLFVRTVVLALLVGGWTLAALALHVVVVPHPEEGQDFKVVVIPKDRLTFSDTYADTRDWTGADLAQNETLARRMIAAGQGEHLSHVLSESIRSRLDGLTATQRSVLSSAN